MSARRLHSVTAICLAVLYGVVGIAGESLHYLATASSAFWSANPASDATYYYHVHAPDNHGHFHSHPHRHHHHAHSHGAPVSRNAERTDNQTASFAVATYAHEPHGCPALALVSHVKLSQSVAIVSLSAATTAIGWTRSVEQVFSLQPLTCACPRGPPSPA
jgi:hypothetical protein